MDDLRACIAPFPSLEPRVFSFFFLFTEGIAVIGEEVLRNLAVAGAAVLLVSLLLLANFYAAALVLLVIVSVDVCLLGFLHVRRTCVVPPQLACAIVGFIPPVVGIVLRSSPGMKSTP